MKKLFSIASLALLAASMLMTGCKKDNDGNIFHLKIQQYQGQNKTTLGDNDATLWVDGDQVYVNGATDADKVTVNDSQAEVTSAPINGKYYFFYPGNCSVTGFDADAGTFTYTMPSQFDADALKAPMAGVVSTGQTVDFYNLCTMLELSFENIIPEQVVITSDNTAINGTFSVSVNDDGSFTQVQGPASVTSEMKRLTINTPASVAGSTTNTTYKMYVPLPAGEHQLTINGIYFKKNMLSAQQMDQNYVYPITCTAHKFSVGANQQVFFSLGNLQYKTVDQTWCFAQNQWDITSDTKTDRNGTAILGLFVFGASGNTVQPTASSTTITSSLNSSNDWGHNPIINGGNQSGIWRTLTSEEWQYIIDYSTITHCQIGTQYGVVISPDGMDITISSSYTTDEWKNIENQGAIFLPFAGFNLGGTNPTWNFNGTQCRYWTSTVTTVTTNNKVVNQYKFFGISMNNATMYKQIGTVGNPDAFASVRLVRNAN